MFKVESVFKKVFALTEKVFKYVYNTDREANILCRPAALSGFYRRFVSTVQ